MQQLCRILLSLRTSGLITGEQPGSRLHNCTCIDSAASRFTPCEWLTDQVISCLPIAVYQPESKEAALLCELRHHAGPCNCLHDVLWLTLLSFGAELIVLQCWQRHLAGWLPRSCWLHAAQIIKSIHP